MLEITPGVQGLPCPHPNVKQTLHSSIIFNRTKILLAPCGYCNDLGEAFRASDPTFRLCVCKVYQCFSFGGFFHKMDIDTLELGGVKF